MDDFAWKVAQADALGWAAQYDGPKFHALLCDPPYELGFMGKDWDRSGIAFKPDTWAALAEHLHPGAFGMAFASARGWHRLAVAIEDAGLRIHPSIFGWSYGCLSDDTEILTSEGWKSYRDDLTGSMVLCYNIDDSSLFYMPAQETFRYEISDTAYRIGSDSTDQIVTKDHRCLIERDGRIIYQAAARLEKQARVPVLEYLPDMRGDFLQASSLAAQNQAELLQAEVPTYLAVNRSRASRLDAANFTIGNGGRKPTRIQLQESASWPKQSSMERRRDLLSEKGQLWRVQDQVRALPGRVPGNGPQGWVHNGAPAISGSGDGQIAKAGGSRASQRPRPREQQPGQLDALCQQQPTQEIRGAWRTSTTLATVTPIHYEGIVWCVRVPTGAFVARRNGQVFITGNSGFPKASRLDTQINKAAGAERKVVGTAADYARDGYDRKGKKHKSRPTQQVPGGDRWELPVTIPATPLARAWQGHRYGLQAMKPALEPIIVFQKPYQGKPVNCITETGAGALWIDGGRIGYQGNNDREQATPQGKCTARSGRLAGKAQGGGERAEFQRPEQKGRWPANFCLVHHPECREVGTRRVKPAGGSGVCSGQTTPGKSMFGMRGKPVTYADPDGLETVAAWECVKGGIVETEVLIWDNMELTPFSPIPDLLESMQRLANHLSQLKALPYNHTGDKRSSLDYESGYAVGLSELPSFQACCLPCRRFYDELAQKVQVAALTSSRQLADAQRAVVRFLDLYAHNRGTTKSAPLSSLGDSDRSGQFPDIEQNSILGLVPCCEYAPETPCRISGTGASHGDEFCNIQESKIHVAFYKHKTPFHSACIDALCRLSFVLAYKTSSWYLPLTLYHKDMELASCPVRRLGEQSGERPAGAFPKRANRTKNIAMSGDNYPRERPERLETGTGTAARFFHQSGWSYEVAEQLAEADPVRYQAKASRKERDAGLGKFDEQPNVSENYGTKKVNLTRKDRSRNRVLPVRNPHPTVKPIALARWLATLLLPPPEYAPRRILIPFSGSGSEGIGAGLAGWDEITMIDNEVEYCEIAEARMAHWMTKPKQVEFAIMKEAVIE